LAELQIKLIHKDGNQCISKEVKQRKFLNHLMQYIETTLVLHILDSWTFNVLDKKGETYEGTRKHERISATPNPARHATTQTVLNSSCNHCRDRKTDRKKTGSNPGRTPATKTTSTKDPHWELVNKM